METVCTAGKFRVPVNDYIANGSFCKLLEGHYTLPSTKVQLRSYF